MPQSAAMKTLLIVFHSMTGGARQMADAAARGAATEPAIAVRRLEARDAGAADVLAADGYLFVTPENLAAMAGVMKDFFDRSYYPCLEKTDALPFACYIRAGQDGTGTRRAIESITTGLRWKAVQEPLVLRGAWQEGFVAQVEELGMVVAAGLEAGVF